MDELSLFLKEKVLLHESDTLPKETEIQLQKIRREKIERPVIFISYGTNSMIAGAEKNIYNNK